MIAREVGIDISTLYYHWGEKVDLYEAVITDLNEAIQHQFSLIENQARGKRLAERLEIAIEVMCDYLHDHPEVSNLLLLGYFSKSKTDVSLDQKVAVHIANIAIAMGLAVDKAHVSPQAKARIMTLWNAVLNFISGESFFRPILGVDAADYLDVVKETLKVVMIPAFTCNDGSGGWPLALDRPDTVDDSSLSPNRSGTGQRRLRGNDSPGKS